jgi:two-component system cell cycle sensor histidine kinase/response regulator CckA
LSTAYGIVKQTGGFIFAGSVVGRGASFTLLFPMFDGATVATPLPPAAKPVQQVVQDTGVIMLVEDEAPVRAFAFRALKMQGFTVIEADCAEMALEKLEIMDTKSDMFLTDVVMPGLDGPTWVRQALKGRPDTRVVFVSGYAEDAFKEGEQAIPNAVFLPKPFSLSELTNTVKAQLHDEPA